MPMSQKDCPSVCQRGVRGSAGALVAPTLGPGVLRLVPATVALVAEGKKDRLLRGEIGRGEPGIALPPAADDVAFAGFVSALLENALVAPVDVAVTAVAAAAAATAAAAAAEAEGGVAVGARGRKAEEDDGKRRGVIGEGCG